MTQIVKKVSLAEMERSDIVTLSQTMETAAKIQ